MDAAHVRNSGETGTGHELPALAAHPIYTEMRAFGAQGQDWRRLAFANYLLDDARALQVAVLQELGQLGGSVFAGALPRGATRPTFSLSNRASKTRAAGGICDRHRILHLNAGLDTQLCWASLPGRIPVRL